MVVRPWRAEWIGFDADPREDLGVFAFRCRWDAAEAPASARVRVTADQRYRLLVNGETVGCGPDRGDPLHWRYREMDLAPHLRQGVNWVAALVWNFGRWAPMAQATVRTGFLLEVEGDGSLSTPGRWEVARLPGWHWDMMHSGIGEFYIDVGPGEVLDAADLPWGWETGEEGEDLLDWRTPHGICPAVEGAASGGGAPWRLVPTTIPAQVAIPRARRPAMRSGFLGEGGAVATEVGWLVRSGAPVLLDFEELMCAYPLLTATGPEGSTLILTYAESLWTAEGTKGDRHVVQGKEMRGVQDRFFLDGRRRIFQTLWWRAFRYVLVEFEGPPEADGVGGQAVFDLDAIKTGYPFQVESSFTAADPSVASVWDVGVRTLRRCAGETYFDCPYYEQLQYAGDTRLQALAGYYLGPDRALTRQAVDHIWESVLPSGLTQSRYPSRQPQVIPPFSLIWVLMLHDQWLYDPRGPRPEHLDVADRVLEAWRKLLEDPDQAFWCFADWVPEWRMGMPPGGPLATVHRLTERLAEIALHEMRGGNPMDLRPSLEADFRLEGALRRHHRDPSLEPSAHAEALWRIAQRRVGLVPDRWPADALLAAPACTYYFDFYRHEAIRPLDYLGELGPWIEMIAKGLTTFAENPEPTRSDCHAWSAHPVIGFFRHVAGIESAGPGWSRIQVEPRPGRLREFKARIAHPMGEIEMAFSSGRIHGQSPAPLELRWGGKVAQFAPGPFEA